MTALVPVPVLDGQLVLGDTLTPDEAVAWVMDAYGQAVEGVIETGRRLLQLRAGKLHGDWGALFDEDRPTRLPFSRTSAHYLMTVAGHPVLANVHHGEHLPTSWRTLAELARLPADEVIRRIESGEISPTLERSTVQDWIRADGITPVPGTPPLPTGTFRTIEADPPWSYASNGAPNQRGADNTYAVMGTPDICALPVQQLAAPNGCHLYLWTTSTHLREAFDVVDAWGFRYRTVLTWLKPRMGLGSHWRGQAEYVLFATAGDLPPESRDKPNVFTADAPKRHSAKPDGFYDLVETVSPGPYVRLFARAQRDNWTSWGAEA